ncbi:MAG: nucleoid occlusion factor SlmA [Gammaproteobacteria bacterium]|nr:nucleoid occlusion factor SlmA [Gammaproteobacteria bacterium]
MIDNKENGAETIPEPSRKAQILQSLASILENNPGSRITTAGLAKEVGVSEAALYRHFPSKAKMFDSLLEFVENTLFSRISKILNEENNSSSKCRGIVILVLTFSEKNPGISRVLTGDALTGETERLRHRVNQLFERIEVQIKQVLKEIVLVQHTALEANPSIYANLLISFLEGKIGQYVRSDFTRLPTQDLDSQWDTLSRNIFKEV